MNTFQFTLGIALGTTLALGAASAAESAATIITPTVNLGDRSKPCTLSGETATGREWGRLIVTGLRLEPGGVVAVECSRIRTGGEAPQGALHCKSRQFYEAFGCTSIVDVGNE